MYKSIKHLNIFLLNLDQVSNNFRFGNRNQISPKKILSNLFKNKNKKK